MGPAAVPTPWRSGHKARGGSAPTFADGLLRLVVRGISKMAHGPGRLRPGTPGTYQGAQGSTQGEGPVFAVMAGVRSRTLGEGGFRCHQVYYWGGIMCPLVRCVLC